MKIRMNRPGWLSCLLAGLSIGVFSTSALAQAPPANGWGVNPTASHGAFIIVGPGGNVFIGNPGTNGVIEYSRLNLESGKTLAIAQGANARLLNYINSADPSHIWGTIQRPGGGAVRGTVYFVNPAGVIFGPTAHVNVTQLYAAAAEIANPANFFTDFVDGNQVTFSSLGDGMVANYGMISAAEAVHFIGRQVANYGTINVNNGIISMTAHDGSVTIGEIGGKHYVQVAGGGASLPAGQYGVVNSGTLDAGNFGSIMLGAGDHYSLAIKLTTSDPADADASFVSPGFKMNASSIAFGGSEQGNPTPGIGETNTRGNLFLDGAIALDADDVEFFSPVNRAFGATDAHLHVKGNADFHGNVGVIGDGLSSLTVDGDTEVFAGLIRTEFSQHYGGTIIFNGLSDYTLSAGTEIHVGGNLLSFGNLNMNSDIFLGGENNAVFGNWALGGNVFFNGGAAEQNARAIGGSLTIDGAAIRTTLGSLLLGGTDGIFLGGNAFAWSNLTFENDITFTSAADQSAVALGGTLWARGKVNSTGGDLTLFGNMVDLDDNVLVQGGGSLDIVGLLMAQGHLTADEHIVVHSDGATVLGNVHAINGDVSFANNATIGNLLAGTGNVTAGRNVIFGSNGTVLGSVNAGRNVVFGNTGLVLGQIDAVRNVLFGPGGFVVGDINAGRNVLFGANGNVGGDINAGRNVLFGADGLVFGNILAGRNVLFGSNSVVGGNIDAGRNVLFGAGGFVVGNIDAQRNVLFGNGGIVGGDIDAGRHVMFGNNGIVAGNIDAGRHVLFGDAGLVAGSIDAGWSVMFGNSGLVGGYIDAGQNVSFGNNGTVFGYIDAGQNVSFGNNGTVFDNIDAGQNVSFGNNGTVFGSIDAGQNVSFGSNGTVFDNIDAGQNVSFGNVGTVFGNIDAGQNVAFGLLGTVSGNIDAGENVAFGDSGFVSGNIDAGQNVAFGDFSFVGGDIDAGQSVAFGNFGNVGGNIGAGQNVVFGTDGTVHGNISAGNDITFGTNAAFGGNVIAGQNISLLGNSTFFGTQHQTAHAQAGTLHAGGPITSTGGDLTLGGAAGIILDGAVNVQGNGGNLFVLHDVIINGKSIKSTGAQTYSGAVTLGDNTTMDASAIDFLSSIDGPFKLVLMAHEGDISFGGRVGGASPLAGLRANAFSDGSMIIFDTDLVHVVGKIRLNVGNDIPSDHTLATIGGTGDLTIIAEGGTFEMGQNQKMSVLGDLLIQANKAKVGDLNTLGDMTIDANSIVILLRPAVDGFDQGVDFVAGGQIFFSVVPSTRGEGPPPQFANPFGNVDGVGTLRGFLQRAFGRSLVASDLRINPFLDLSAQGAANEDLSTALSRALPDEEDEASDDAQLAADDIRQLVEQVGFVVRMLHPDEVAEFARGRAMYLDGRNVWDDLGLTGNVAMADALQMNAPLASLDPSLLRVREGYSVAEELRRRPAIVAPRLDIRYVRTFLNSHREMMMDAEQAAEAIGRSWERYEAVAGDYVQPSGYVAYLLAAAGGNPASADAAADARQSLDSLRRLSAYRQQLQSLGLSSVESASFFKSAAEQFTPDQITLQELIEAIEGLGAAR